jgi:hypothetical protein
VNLVPPGPVAGLPAIRVWSSVVFIEYMYLFVAVLVVVVELNDNSTCIANVKSKIKDQRIEVQICVGRVRGRLPRAFDGECNRSILASR